MTKKQWIETKCQEAEHATAKDDARSLYKIVRDLTGSSPNTSIPIKNKAGPILLSEEEQNTGWVEHFSEVLNQSVPTILLDLDGDINNATDYADISMNNISKEETEEGLRALANNKVASLDFISAELLKWVGDTVVDKLTKIATIVSHTVKVPDEWKCGAIMKLSNKRDLRDCDYWRGITLLIIARKILFRVLLK